MTDAAATAKVRRMPINHRRLIRRATVPAAALLAGSALAISSADGQAARTLTFTGSAPVPRDFKQVDVRPRGLAVGG